MPHPFHPDRPEAPPPDAHGQAALLLVESLIHGLIKRGVLTSADAVEIVDIATDVKEEMGYESGEPVSPLHRSLMLLERIEWSLFQDGG